jgi:hypothetical protein
VICDFLVWLKECSSALGEMMWRDMLLVSFLVVVLSMTGELAGRGW